MTDAINSFWKAALKAGGLATIGAYLVYTLCKDWLKLPIFAQMTGTQTFWIMLVFLVLLFGLALRYLTEHARTTSLPVSNADSANVFKLHEAWVGVNDVETAQDKLIGPDVVKANEALTITSASWRHNLVSRSIIIENYYDSYKLLCEKLKDSETVVPGFEYNGKKCKDFISLEMIQTLRF